MSVRRAAVAVVCVLLGVTGVVACGASASSIHPHTSRGRTASSRGDASASAVPAGPSAMERLAALATKSAPGMRELLRRDVTSTSTSSARVELAAAGKDTCLRIFVAADFAAKATLESKGRELDVAVAPVTATSDAATDAGARETTLVLGPRGPVCVHHDVPAVLRIDGTGNAHVIVRASP